MMTTLDDALDVARSLRGRLEDLDQPELAAEAGKLVAYIVEQAHDIERQRARRAIPQTSKGTRSSKARMAVAAATSWAAGRSLRGRACIS